MTGILTFLLHLALLICIIFTFVEPVDNDSKSSATKIKKLQIGIKKRIEGCEVKSKKGDVLHMHYKVHFILFFYFFLIIVYIYFFKIDI